MEYDVRPQAYSRKGIRRKKVEKFSTPDPHVPILFVTSFSAAGYQDYGKRFLEGFVKFWPKDALLAVFHEGERPPIEDDRILYFDLRNDQEFQEFLLKHGHDPRANGQVTLEDGRTVRDWRRAAVRFAPKIFAISSPVLPTSTWRIWIDADVETKAPIPETYFSKLLRHDKVTALYLGRPKSVFRTSECGFVAYRLLEESGRQFVQDFRLNYTTGKIFEMPEWHDSFVFDALRTAYEGIGCKFHDLAASWYSGLDHERLTFEEHGHPWPHTKLGPYLVHHKGPAGKGGAIEAQAQRPQQVDLKKLCTDPLLKNRYQQIGKILSVLLHKTIVEVGVGTGQTGRNMSLVNLQRGLPVHYIGFDLFEGMTEELRAKELNGKPMQSLDAVTQLFDGLKTEYPSLFTYELVRGNTRDTLPKQKWPEDGVDIVFLDGGHSVETIQSDYEALKEVARLVIFDDYYVSGQDTEKFGCNKLVDSLPTKMKLPVVDSFANGMEIQLVAVGPILAKPGENQEVKVKTRNCVPDEEIQANIRNSARYHPEGLKIHVRSLQEKYKDDPDGLLAAMKEIDPGGRAIFLPGVLRPTDVPVLFVGGSPTVCDSKDKDYASNWATIKELQKTHRVVVCKTSYPISFREGVRPWACFLLDPRDHVAEWIKPMDTLVLFIVASMCHPTTWAHVTKYGQRVLGYHAGVGAQEAGVIVEFFGDSPVVHGGTTSSFRGLSLLYNLGFRHFKTIGLDSSYPTKPEKPHGRSPKPVQKVTLGKEMGKEGIFWTDPELIAQSQDAEMLYKLHPHLDIEYLGNGMLQHAQMIYKEMVKKADPLSIGPIEHRVGAWFGLFRQNAKLSEALFAERVAEDIAKRAQNLSAALGLEPTFDEFLSG